MAHKRIAAIGASAGLGLGTAVHHRPPVADPVEPEQRAPLPARERPAELGRLRAALAAAAADLDALAAEAARRLGAAGAVFAAQALFPRDPSLIEPLEAAILASGQPALMAVRAVFGQAATALERLEDAALRARAADLRDVEARLSALLGGPGSLPLEQLPEGAVLLADDLTPSAIMRVPLDRVRGIVLAAGSPLAHVALLARGIGIPLVVGAGEVIWSIPAGRQVALDGAEGLVLAEPDAGERAAYGRPDAVDPVRGAHPAVYSPAATRDGHRVGLLANANTPDEAARALALGAEGIGLLRTEFLPVMLRAERGAPPDQEELATAYEAILRVMGGHPVVVRALDAGGDKPLPFLDLPSEANPMLGRRGIRLLLDHPDLFAGQLRALSRAVRRTGADARLLLPMVTVVEEVRHARRLVEDACRAEGLAQLLPLGVLIEVPAAALQADALAREADFLSVGTNDLAAYTMAADRGNPAVAALCRVTHPAVLRLVAMTVEAAHAAGCRVSVCGEAAADAEALPLLIGLGVDDVSVAPASLEATRACLAGLSYADAQRLAATGAR